MTDIKTDNSATLVNALAEIERLRGRVSELIEYADGPGELAGDHNWEMLKAGEKSGRAFILRKQAEAVEGFVEQIGFDWPKSFDNAIREDAKVYAQRLRTQANELEAGGAG